MEKIHQLEGTAEQCAELLRAVTGFKSILFTLGGDSENMDSAIEKRLSRLSYWEQLLLARLS